jgi:hypothetical protein
MTDTSMCLGDLSSGDEFESNQFSCAESKRYLKLSSLFREGIHDYANAVEMVTGDPASFEPEDRISLVRSATGRAYSREEERKAQVPNQMLRLPTPSSRNAVRISILLKAAAFSPRAFFIYKITPSGGALFLYCR